MYCMYVHCIHTACCMSARTSVNSSLLSATSGASASASTTAGAGTWNLIVHWRFGAFCPGLMRSVLISRAYNASVNCGDRACRASVSRHNGQEKDGPHGPETKAPHLVAADLPIPILVEVVHRGLDLARRVVGVVLLQRVNNLLDRERATVIGVHVTPYPGRFSVSGRLLRLLQRAH